MADVHSTRQNGTQRVMVASWVQIGITGNAIIFRHRGQDPTKKGATLECGHGGGVPEWNETRIAIPLRASFAVSF